MKKDEAGDWLQKGKESLKKMEQRREAVAGNIDRLDKSDLLARLESKKQEIERQTLYRFEITPIQRDTDLNQIAGYKVQHGSSSFSIVANENGIYLDFTVGRLIRAEGEEQPSIDPSSLSDDEIHDWFGRIVSHNRDSGQDR
jgi:hypothetical protein